MLNNAQCPNNLWNTLYIFLEMALIPSSDDFNYTNRKSVIRIYLIYGMFVDAVKSLGHEVSNVGMINE
jgi:hypothetical protein